VILGLDEKQLTFDEPLVTIAGEELGPEGVDSRYSIDSW
jgi:hypothetical protein